MFLSCQLHKVKGDRHTDRWIDRPTDRRTDMCNAICPPFSKGGMIMTRSPLSTGGFDFRQSGMIWGFSTVNFIVFAFTNWSKWTKRRYLNYYFYMNYFNELSLVVRVWPLKLQQPTMVQHTYNTLLFYHLIWLSFSYSHTNQTTQILSQFQMYLFEIYDI